MGSRICEVLIEGNNDAPVLLCPTVKELIRSTGEVEFIDMIDLPLGPLPPQPISNGNRDILIQQDS